MKIIDSGNILTLSNIINSYEKLPVGNYMLKYDDKVGFFLSRKPEFRLPKKLYGDFSEIDRWLKSYNVNSDKNLGIILSGLKGTGKTIMCQKFCIDSKKSVISINEGYSGSDFIDFITNPLFRDSIIFIDEFEKIYDQYGRDNLTSPTDMISIMDGGFDTKLLFLLTVNDLQLNQYLMNRPGRIKYRKNFTNIPAETIDQVIDDMLINKNHRQSVHLFFETLGMSSFDLLVSIIKDMNLFNEDAITAGKYMNLEKLDSSYTIVLTEPSGNKINCYPFSGNLSSEIINVYHDDMVNPDSEESIHHEIRRSEVSVKRVGNNYIIKNNEGFSFNFTFVDRNKWNVF